MRNYIVLVQPLRGARTAARAFYAEGTNAESIYEQFNKFRDEDVIVSEAEIGAPLIPAMVMLQLRNLNWHYGRGDIRSICFDSVSGEGLANIEKKGVGHETAKFRFRDQHLTFRGHTRKVF
jgi:hypothetical protein